MPTTYMTYLNVFVKNTKFSALVAKHCN